MSIQAGIWNLNGNPADEQLLLEVSNVMNRHHSNNVRVSCCGSLGMTYRSLHTTHESRLVEQPQTSDHGCMLTWDGRLDNRSDLIETLHLRASSDISDCTIVLAAVELWGAKSFRMLLGDWALALWDPHDQILTLARDFVGVRPLYYELKPERVLWCTHLEPIVLSARHSWTLDEEYVAGYFASLPAAHRTPYAGIKSVPPGTLVRIRRNSTASTNEYWSFNPKKTLTYRTDSEYEAHFRHIFGQAVRRRLRSDSPVLAELSGGIDSSSIVCMADALIAMGDANTQRLDTISYYDDEEPNWNERPYFTKVEQLRGRTGLHIDVGKSQFLVPVENSCFISIPGTTQSALEFERCRLRHMEAQGSRVLLSGFGGDEFTGGVPTPIPELGNLLVQLRLLEFATKLRMWSFSSKQPLIQLLIRTLSSFSPVNRFRHRTAHTQMPRWLEPNFIKRHWKIFHETNSYSLFDSYLPSQQAHLHCLDTLKRQLACSSHLFPGRYEQRYPFLDRDFIEFILSIPRSQLVRPGQRRSLIRRALAGIVPAEILNRKRKAFIGRGLIRMLDQEVDTLNQMFRVPLSGNCGYVEADRFLECVRNALHGKELNMLGLLRTVDIEFWLRDLHRRQVVTDSDMRVTRARDPIAQSAKSTDETAHREIQSVETG